MVVTADFTACRWTIVDGFHRYFTCKSNADILGRNCGYLPIVVIDKDINDRMASTVRHNRARGKHSVQGMSNMVFEMLNNGWEDAAICNELGMEPEELLRLKHITGFSKLFADAEYHKAWVARRQIKVKQEYKARVAAGEDEAWQTKPTSPAAPAATSPPPTPATSSISPSAAPKRATAKRKTAKPPSPPSPTIAPSRPSSKSMTSRSPTPATRSRKASAASPAPAASSSPTRRRSPASGSSPRSN